MSHPLSDNETHDALVERAMALDALADRSESKRQRTALKAAAAALQRIAAGFLLATERRD